MDGVVSFELFKQHCCADDLGGADDLKLRHYLAVATEVVTAATGRSFDEILEMSGGAYPLRLQQAVLMLGAYYYSQPEAATNANISAVPFGIMALVAPFRKLTL